MFAVIETGGKQYKVEEGQQLEVELLGTDSKATFTPVLLVDGKKVLSGKDVAKAKVDAKIVGESKGKKINAFNYKNKSRIRKRWGHRQHYSVIEITKIAAGSTAKAKAADEAGE